MADLDEYYGEYTAGRITGYCSSGYTCPSCGQWVPGGTVHYCWGSPYRFTWYPVENPTEKAFRVLKKLVEEKIIKEPNTLKEFCNLVEKIAEAI